MVKLYVYEFLDRSYHELTQPNFHDLISSSELRVPIFKLYEYRGQYSDGYVAVVKLGTEDDFMNIYIQGEDNSMENYELLIPTVNKLICEYYANDKRESAKLMKILDIMEKEKPAMEQQIDTLERELKEAKERLEFIQREYDLALHVAKTIISP